LRNRIYLGEIVHKGQSHRGEHPPIIDQPLWEAVQAQLAGHTPQRNPGTPAPQLSPLAGMLFDRDGNRSKGQSWPRRQESAQLSRRQH